MNKKGRLLFTCTLAGGDESHPFKISLIQNVFDVTGFTVQMNHNDAALEVADDKGKPLLQVIQDGPNRLKINGVFLLGVSSSTGKIVRLWAWENRFESDTQRPTSFDLKPIFKYPSWKYPGEYAESN
jgi:hypothetical protein